MADRVRVLILIAGLAIGEPLGGAERFGAELACSLNREKFEPMICAFWRRDTSAEHHWVEYLTRQGIEVFFASKWPGKFSLLRYVKGLANIISYLKNKPVAVIHSHFQVGSVSALILKNKIGAKSVIRTAHLSPDREWGGGLSGAICRQVFTRFFFPIFVDAEVGVSQAAVRALNQRIVARVFGRQAALIHNAIPVERFRRKESGCCKRQDFGLSKDDLVVGSVGRLTKQKGFKYLLEAVPIVIARLPNTKFIIVGEGELYPQLKAQAKNLGISDSVIFMGPRQDVECLYNIMDLFVLPSLWEGLPTVVLESMASGIPVVATDIPGTRELITPGYTGWLAKPGDADSLANAIVYALRHPSLRAEIAKRALEVIIPQYSMERIASQYQNLYHRLLSLSEIKPRNALI